MFVLLFALSHALHIVSSSVQSTAVYNQTTTNPPTATANVTQPPTNSNATVNVTQLPTASNATVNVTQAPIPCIVPCQCYWNLHGLITAKCNLQMLPDGWTLPGRFQALDLSYNKLTKVPQEFFRRQNLSNLLSLSLKGNNISIIEEDAFQGLYNLTRLDISFISLKEWKGDIKNSLTSLMYLDVTGNFPWIPTLNVLAITSLRAIYGVTWSDKCFNCIVTNNLYNMHVNESTKPNLFSLETTHMTDRVSSNNTDSGQTGQTFPGNPNTDNTDFHLKIDHTVPNFFRDNGYFPHCLQVPMMLRWNCFPGGITPAKTKHLLKIPSQLFYIAYVLGALGIVLNCSIIIIYMYSTNIRKINSMLLISNMAFCDILVGVYAIIIAKYNIFSIMLTKGDVMPNSVITIGSFCKVASVLFTVGQVVSVFTALLLTIDKFLSIVYCMDPNRKLSRRLSLLVLFLCWVGVIVYAFSPEFSVMVYSPALMCTFPVTEMKVFIISVCLLVAFYLANIPLYVKIFLFVRRSSVRMGVRRDAALAKKIAVLILTNFVFFAVPMILIIVFSLVFNLHYLVSFNDITLVRFIVCYLLPIVCLCLNSCLNPFLCAFRQRQFRREFKKCMHNCILSRFCKAISTIRTDSSVRNTQPTRVEMYKLSNIDSQTQGM